MSSPSGRNTNTDCLYASKLGDIYVIRVVGMGNMHIAPALSEFMTHAYENGARRFLFDMLLCTGLDSTFMGIMVGQVTQFRISDEESGGDWFEDELSSVENGDQPDMKMPAEVVRSWIGSVNVSEHCRNCMRTVGVDKYVAIGGSHDLEYLEYSLVALPSLPPNRRNVLIINAHENLIKLDDSNKEKFEELVELLNVEIDQEQNRQAGLTADG